MGWRPAYATTAEFKTTANVTSTDRDNEIDEVIEAASRGIDWTTGRQFGAVASAEERVYEAIWDREESLWRAEIDDLMTTTSLVVDVDGTALASTSYRLGPRNRVLEGLPYEYIHTDDATTPTLGSGARTLEITGIWGWTSSDAEAIPTPITRATILVAQKLWWRHDAPFGVAGSAQLNGEIRSMIESDPDLHGMVRPFYRLAQAGGFA